MNRRLEQIHVFLIANEQGDEGVAAYNDPKINRLVPMIAATDEKLEELTAIAQEIVSLNPLRPMRIVRFSGREDVAEVSVDVAESADPGGAA